MRSKLFTGLTLALLATAAAGQDPTGEATPAANDEEQTVYAIGLSVWNNLLALDLTPAEIEIVQRAIADAASGAKPEVELEEYQAKIGEFRSARLAARAERAKAAGLAYAESAAQEPGAVQADSGLVYFEIEPGTGDQPTAADTVKVHYTGTFLDGAVFDSSQKRGQPTEFPLGRVIPCWTEGLQKMKAGGKSRLICPSDIAYGDRGRGPIPGGATLVFEVELLEIKKAQAPASEKE